MASLAYSINETEIKKKLSEIAKATGESESRILKRLIIKEHRKGSAKGREGVQCPQA